MSFRLVIVTAVCSLLVAPAAFATATGGAVAADDTSAPAPVACLNAPALPVINVQGGVHAAAVQPLLAIVARPLPTRRRIMLSVDTASAGCLNLALYTVATAQLPATMIGALAASVSGPGRATVVVRLNAAGVRMLRGHRRVAATLVTDFRSTPLVSGAEVTLGTPVWLG